MIGAMGRCRRALAVLSLAAAAASCSSPAREAQPTLAQVATTAGSTSSAALAPPLEPPPMPHDEALRRGKDIAERWMKDLRYRRAETQKWAAEAGVSEHDIRRMVAALTRDCVKAKEKDDEACKELLGASNDGASQRQVVEPLVEVLGEIADTRPNAGPTTGLLLALDARGLWRAESSLERILERRLEASRGACAPPTPDRVAAARASLDGFVVVEPPKSAGAPLSVRRPTPAELDDLAYFYAAVGANGAEVGTAKRDESAKPLADGDPAIALRAKLVEEVRLARERGDAEAHVRHGLALLSSFGYPGPIRAAEERDRRWGGLGLSFVMREVAFSAELVGRFDVAEALYRRAEYAGGACGTSAPSYRDDQIRGAIRSSEAAGGCGAAVAERLFGVASDAQGSFGPRRLTEAGFDVPRLYRGAIVTAGREDEDALRRALSASPLGAGALDRLARLGLEDWSRRVRAIPGLADTARAGALDALLALASTGPGEASPEAIASLGLLLEDRGFDPCKAEGIGFGYGSSDNPRHVGSVMLKCETRLAPATIERIVRALAARAADADPRVREEVARALGRIGAPSGRAAVQKLARDAFNTGGETCRSYGTPQQRCEPTRPVRFAAQDAIERLDEAAKARASR
jgi:hypothetical protein